MGKWLTPLKQSCVSLLVGALSLEDTPQLGHFPWLWNGLNMALLQWVRKLVHTVYHACAYSFCENSQWKHQEQYHDFDHVGGIWWYPHSAELTEGRVLHLDSLQAEVEYQYPRNQRAKSGVYLTVCWINMCRFILFRMNIYVKLTIESVKELSKMRVL